MQGINKMLPNATIRDAFFDNFPGFISIRDSQHRIIYLNDNVKKWLGQFVKTSIIGLTNKQIRETIENPYVAELFDEKYDLSVDEINNTHKKSTVMKYYNNGVDNLFDMYKFTKIINSEVYIFTMAIDITNSYNEMMFFKNKAQLDSLTGAYNRSILDSIRPSKDSIFVYFDIDKFKEINDSLGHAIGDDVLCEMVQAIKNCVRDDDVLIRMGGDEFLLIMNKIDIMEVGDVMLRVTKKLNRSAVKYSKPLSFSHGIARYEGTIDETLTQVDQKMYEVKERRKQEKL